MHPTPSFCSVPVALPSKVYSANHTKVEQPIVSPSPGNVARDSELDDSDGSKNTLPIWRKATIVFVASWMVMTAMMSSTALFAAVPEISSSFSVSAGAVTTTNSLVFLSMALSTFIWGPITAIIGRHIAFNSAIAILFLCSIGAALAPNLTTLVTVRVLAGFETCLFNVAGQTMIADIFDPVSRGTAVGFFMAGTTISPALGPLLGGIMVTFSTWRSIFWLQTIMAALGLILSSLFIPSALSLPLKSRDSTLSLASLKLFNPLPTLSLIMYPNILLTDLTCGFLGWVQYSLLASPRNLPIFTGVAAPSSLTPSLFYLAPGAGFLVGTLVGGKFSDNTVRRYIESRGFRLPQDRLNASLAGFFIATVAFLIYGWALQKSVGGIPLAAVSIFVTGFGLMASFNCLNTYSAEVLPLLRSQVMGGKYLVQYAFAAAGSASIVPLIESVGIGSACTISVALVLVGSGCTMIVARRGQDMQEWWMEKNSQ